MSAVSLKTKRPVNGYSPAELKRIMQDAMRQVLREEITSVRVDARGYLIFPNEAEYAAYLETQPDKLPSDVKASYIDPQGFRVHYSDYEPTLKKARELDAARKERTLTHENVREMLTSRGVKV